MDTPSPIQKPSENHDEQQPDISLSCESIMNDDYVLNPQYCCTSVVEGVVDEPVIEILTHIPSH